MGFSHSLVFCFVAKCGTSLDDLIWLSPFLTKARGRDKVIYSQIYMAVCILVTMIAYLISFLIKLTFHKTVSPSSSSHWFDANRALALLAFFGLGFMALRDYGEWKKEREERVGRERIRMDEKILNCHTDSPFSKVKREESPERYVEGLELAEIGKKAKGTYQGVREEGESFSIGGQSPTTLEDLRLSGKDGDPEDAVRVDIDKGGSAVFDGGTDGGEGGGGEGEGGGRERIEEASKGYWRMFMVTIMGTLDDMLVFTALVSGAGNGSSKEITALPLLIGATAAAVCILSLAFQLSRIPWFRRCMKRVPMWALLGGIAVYVLVIGMVG